MDIEKVVIERPTYGPNKGKYVATIRVAGSSVVASPAIDMPIPDEALQPIVEIIAQATVAVMQKATADFISGVQAQLAGPAIDAPALEQRPGDALPEGDVSI